MRKIKLGEVCDLKSGYAFKSSDYVEKSNTLTCRMSNIRPGAIFDIGYNIKYLPDEYADKYKEFLLYDDDIIIAMTDLAGDPKILGVPAKVITNGYNILQNQRVGKLIIKDEDKINFDFLKHALSNPQNREYYKKFAGGGLQINISNKDILNIQIPIYNKQEQIKISNQLNRIQEIIDIRKKQIEELDELIKAQFIDMFGNKNFEKKEIRELVNKNIIKAKKKFSNGEKIKYIDISSIDNIKNQVIGFNEFEMGKEPSRAQQCLEKNDILISTVRPNLKNIAVNKYVYTDVVGTSGFCVLRPEKCLLEYLLYVVLSDEFTNDMVSKTTGANYPAISNSDVLDYKIELPPIVLQNQFAEFVKLIDKQKFKIQKSLEEMERLQKSVMNKYFC